MKRLPGGFWLAMALVCASTLTALYAIGWQHGMESQWEVDSRLMARVHRVEARARALSERIDQAPQRLDTTEEVQDELDALHLALKECQERAVATK